MILEIFNKGRERIGVLNKYSFVQYIDKFVDIGSFSLKAPFTQENWSNLVKRNYILLDKEVMGVITYRKRERSETSDIEVKGFLLSSLLAFRSFKVTAYYTGQVAEVAYQMVSDMFISPTDIKRTVSFFTNASDSKYHPVVGSISKQVTGDKLSTAVSDLMDAHDLGFDLVPVISKYNELTGQLTNISSMEFRVLHGVDRSIENTLGNDPVVFAISLDNLKSLLYEENDDDYANVAIVAGAGEGVNRTILEVGDTTATGLDRIELYVDANDIQETDADGTSLTPEQIAAAMSSRGTESLNEHVKFTSFEGAINTGGSTFIYGTDFFKGDTITILDEELGLAAAAVVTEVTRSISSAAPDELDFTFGYTKLSTVKRLKKKGVI